MRWDAIFIIYTDIQPISAYIPGKFNLWGVKVYLMSNIRLVISDYDRTFTDGSLELSPGLVEAINGLKKKGIYFSIVSGRKFSFMYDKFAGLRGIADSFVAENGCVGYYEGKKYIICDMVDRRGLFKSLEDRGVPFDHGDVIISVHKDYEKDLLESLENTKGYFHIIKNVDSLMVLPRSVSKGTAVVWLMGRYGFTSSDTACIGDAENDIEMRDFCSVFGAVSNALPSVKAVSDHVTKGSFGDGLKEFLRLIADEYS
jgi:hypothetical protein